MAGETEKIKINLGFVDLGQIDLLVQEGFYFLTVGYKPSPLGGKVFSIALL